MALAHVSVLLLACALRTAAAAAEADWCVPTGGSSGVSPASPTPHPLPPEWEGSIPLSGSLVSTMLSACDPFAVVSEGALLLTPAGPIVSVGGYAEAWCSTDGGVYTLPSPDTLILRRITSRLGPAALAAVPLAPPLQPDPGCTGPARVILQCITLQQDSASYPLVYITLNAWDVTNWRIQFPDNRVLYCDADGGPAFFPITGFLPASALVTTLSTAQLWLPRNGTAAVETLLAAPATALAWSWASCPSDPALSSTGTSSVPMPRDLAGWASFSQEEATVRPARNSILALGGGGGAAGGGGSVMRMLGVQSNSALQSSLHGVCVSAAAVPLGTGGVQLLSTTGSTPVPPNASAWWQLTLSSWEVPTCFGAVALRFPSSSLPQTASANGSLSVGVLLLVSLPATPHLCPTPPASGTLDVDACVYPFGGDCAAPPCDATCVRYDDYYFLVDENNVTTSFGGTSASGGGSDDAPLAFNPVVAQAASASVTPAPSTSMAGSRTSAATSSSTPSITPSSSPTPLPTFTATISASSTGSAEVPSPSATELRPPPSGSGAGADGSNNGGTNGSVSNSEGGGRGAQASVLDGAIIGCSVVAVAAVAAGLIAVWVRRERRLRFKAATPLTARVRRSGGGGGGREWGARGTGGASRVALWGSSDIGSSGRGGGSLLPSMGRGREQFAVMRLGQQQQQEQQLMMMAREGQAGHSDLVATETVAAAAAAAAGGVTTTDSPLQRNLRSLGGDVGVSASPPPGPGGTDDASGAGALYSRDGGAALSSTAAAAAVTAPRLQPQRGSGLMMASAGEAGDHGGRGTAAPAVTIAAAAAGTGLIIGGGGGGRNTFAIAASGTASVLSGIRTVRGERASAASAGGVGGGRSGGSGGEVSSGSDDDDDSDDSDDDVDVDPVMMSDDPVPPPLSNDVQA